MSSKLTKSDWIEFGLKELTENGLGALKAKSLAKKLNVSRGSFYWHFKDISEFETEIIKAWRERATQNIIAAVKMASTPRKRLEALIKETLRAPKIELSVRAWGAASKIVAKSAAEIDAQRYAFISNLLREMGVDEGDIKYRSLLLYWAAVGRTVVPPDNLQKFNDEEITKLADLMSGSSPNMD